MTHDNLTDLRLRLTGCEIAVLADVSTGTCLRAASAVQIGQEAFSEICRDAVLILSPEYGSREVFGIRSSSLGLDVFVRAAPDLNEAVCLVFAPTACLAGVEDAALDFLDREFGEAQSDR